jgi:hypothetical protein
LYAGWCRTGRPLPEFWSSSPAQIQVVLDGHGLLAKKGNAKGLLHALAGAGVKIRRGGSDAGGS